jgi:hypothetical protein
MAKKEVFERHEDGGELFLFSSDMNNSDVDSSLGVAIPLRSLRPLAGLRCMAFTQSWAALS